MRVTLRQLQVLVAAARHNNFSRAAEDLHLSQPAISMQIKQLEAVVGQPIFEQAGKQLSLTDAGHVMLRCANSIQTTLDEASDALSELKGMEGGRLRIAITTTVNYFATRLLAEYCREYPRVSVSLDVTNRSSVIKKLVNNETDVVLMGEPPSGMDLEAQRFMENPLVVIAPPDHRLATQSQVPLTALNDETFLIREQGSGTRRALVRLFDENDLQPTGLIEMTSNEAVKQSVQVGLGVALVSLHTIQLELDAKRLVVLDLERFPLMRQWYVVHRGGKRLSAAARAFEEFTLASAKKA